MNFFNRLLGNGGTKSGTIAKNRLQLVLVQDRVNLSPARMDLLKDDLIEVISKYVDIDTDRIDISLTNTNRQSQLIANIPVVGSRQK